jgi:hypothetical protein
VSDQTNCVKHYVLGPQCAAVDGRLLDGVIFGLLGAEAEPNAFYREMQYGMEFRSPLACSDVT